MTTNIGTTKFLLSYYLASTFQTKLLANVCDKSLDVIYTELTARFVELELTRDDIKDCWKVWFEGAACDGTLLNADFCLYGAIGNYRELEVGDLIIKLSHEAIDSLK